MVEDSCGSVIDTDKTFFLPKLSVAAAVGERGADHATVRQYMPRDHCSESCACTRLAWRASCGCSVSQVKLRCHAWRCVVACLRVTKQHPSNNVIIQLQLRCNWLQSRNSTASNLSASTFVWTLVSASGSRLSEDEAWNVLTCRVYFVDATWLHCMKQWNRENDTEGRWEEWLTKLVHTLTWLHAVSIYALK